MYRLCLYSEREAERIYSKYVPKRKKETTLQITIRSIVDRRLIISRFNDAFDVNIEKLPILFYQEHHFFYTNRKTVVVGNFSPLQIKNDRSNLIMKENIDLVTYKYI